MGFDWVKCAERLRDLLKGVVAKMFVLARIVPGEVPQGDMWMTCLPRYVYRAVMFILEPAEAALRRLLIITARGLVLKARPSKGGPVKPILPSTGASARPPQFNMFDPFRTYENYWRRKLSDEPVKPFPAALPEPQPFALVSAVTLWRRLNALHFALENLPQQVRRYARWRARCNLAIKNDTPLRPRTICLMRPGYAPGYRKRGRQEVHEILRECHSLAKDIVSPRKPWWT